MKHAARIEYSCKTLKLMRRLLGRLKERSSRNEVVFANYMKKIPKIPFGRLFISGSVYKNIINLIDNADQDLKDTIKEIKESKEIKEPEKKTDKK
jgi:hypothetical protein